MCPPNVTGRPVDHGNPRGRGGVGCPGRGARVAASRMEVVPLAENDDAELEELREQAMTLEEKVEAIAKKVLFG